MNNKLILEIVTPCGLVLKEEVDEIVAPGAEGEFGVLAGHISFVTMLKIGMLIYKLNGSEYYVFINSGYAEVSADRVLILADSAERAEDIDIERAKAAMKRAEEMLRKGKGDIDFTRAQAALQRALTRLEVAQKGKQ